MASQTFECAFLHPRYWAVWLGVGLLWLLARLPFAQLERLGEWLGRLLWRLGATRLGGTRREVVETNLALCFPDWSEQKRQQVAKESFENVGMAVAEMAMGWFWSAEKRQQLVTVVGAERLTALEREGKGAILLACHFTNLEFGAHLYQTYRSFDGMQREHDNPLVNYIQTWGRVSTDEGVLYSREDVRGVVKALRAGRFVWYAPDQDYGPKVSIFAPFFGVSAATVPATAKLAKLGKVPVVPFKQTRLGNGRGYRVEIGEPLSGFPVGDEYADTCRINEVVERQVMSQPGQYLWVHRRFKSRPEGESDLYGGKR